jgi:hypothetical protein
VKAVIKHEKGYREGGKTVGQAGKQQKKRRGLMYSAWA